jgi:hypothetical protein
MRRVLYLSSVLGVRIGELSSTCSRNAFLHFYPGRHLIADNLSWFKDSTDGGRLRTVEDLVKERGEKIRRGELKIGEGGEGVLEFNE